ncbi:MAG: hypothetical protein QOI47_1247 [Actinomycetota bacterium]|nr:hypothetical protein [Actinomycetota bacterium]
MLLRITSHAEWLEGRISDDGDGFVHLSGPEQVLTPANDRYAGRRDLLLLVLDEARLDGDVEVEGGFPHLYGTVGADAVTDVVGFACDDDGAFRLALVPMHAGAWPADDLVAAMVAEMEPLYGPIDGDDMPSARPEEMWAPAGTFLVGWDDTGRPVCGGGLKGLGEGVGEIKRMYVAPEARGRGHARRLLTGLEDAARRHGYGRVRLDTGSKQPHALALYRSAGYREIASYNGNIRASYWGEKVLSP